MSRRPIPVTDHAVLRWLERIEGFDIEALRVAIGRSGAVGVEFGADIVVVRGARLILSEGRVVTVYPGQSPAGRLAALAVADPIVSLQSIAPIGRAKRRRRK